ncbi:chymotrypsin-like elastase family member 2A [Patella vulgata]|uniref:chymotrypsin-like elastase family member 2A n=1 Tax=Patella vulgata TaxID=6465 RepID=UPI00217F8832|nr:chymotrypsin-like elastase family member 2A [Patella vulgata]
MFLVIYLVIAVGSVVPSTGQYLNVWQYSVCAYQFGGRCSRSCNYGEHALHPYYCFYGLAHCCVPPPINPVTTPVPTVNTGSVSQRQGKCGAASITQTRIFNGYTGRPCEWPWMVSLRHSTRGLFCSGVLVNKDTVLTAAQCLINAPIQDIKVHLGDYNTNKFDYPEVAYRVQRIDIMDGYKFEVKGKNLAAIKLSTPVEFDRCKTPACLPDPSIPISPGGRCYIAGFGQTEYGGSSTLQAADVTVLDRNICQNLIQVSTGEQLPDDVLCSNTAVDLTDGCQGDDGGMLVCPDSQNRWSLAGIIGYYSCNRLPTLYTNITNYTEWILARL